MAKAKRSGHCKTLTVCGVRRKLCWGKHGIRTNSKPR